ncbi:MAG: TetR/AcrR family transcriptional regulator [bacterium]
MNSETQILQAAQVLFAQFGLKKVTTDDIAREAHVSKATIYKHFKNKSEIFDEVVQEEATQLLGAINAAVDHADTAVDKMRAHLLTRLKLVSDFVNFYRVTQDTWADYWPYIVRVRKHFLAEEQKILAGVLRDGVAKGELDVAQPSRAAQVLVLALASVEYQWSLVDSRLKLEQMVDTMLQMMINGIRKR